MTERIVRQLGEIQRTHGELRAVIVHEPEEWPWFPPPIESTKHAFFAMHSSCTGIIWTESSEYTNAMEDFARLCPELIDSTTHSSELQEWRIPAAEGVENLFRWLWFAAGFALAKLPGRTPRAFRKCWGSNGHFFNPDALEQQRQNLPPAIAANMPPNADNWLAKIENLIQVSIEAVEYLAANSGELVTVKQVAERCFDVEAKTLLNDDVKHWGPHAKKIGRERAWYWQKILPMVSEKRRLKAN